MPLMPPVLLLAALATGPADTTDVPPATCLSAADNAQTNATRRRRAVLPRLVIGLDVAPQRSGRATGDDAMDLTDEAALEPTSATLRTQDRAMTRWSVSLRWSRPSRRGRATSRSASTSPRNALCDRFLMLQAHRPRSLAEAVDLWSEQSRLQALLHGGGEEDHE